MMRASLATVLTTLALGLVSASAGAATFQVNETGDAPDAMLGDDVCDRDTTSPESQCTLRAAIQQANSTLNSGENDQITFAIGSGPQTISLSTALPSISESLTIDGTTQPPTGVAPRITVAAGASGLVGFSVDSTAANSVINGLCMVAWNAAIDSFAPNVTIQGNYLGIKPDGSTSGAANGVGVLLSGAGSVVGDPSPNATPETRNVISNNATYGVFAGPTGSTIANNYLGVSPDGNSAVPNETGIRADGNASISNNVVAAAIEDGVQLSGNGTRS